MYCHGKNFLGFIYLYLFCNWNLMSYSSWLVGMEMVEPVSAKDKYLRYGLLGIGADGADPDILGIG
jgi:hypothetical protein